MCEAMLGGLLRAGTTSPDKVIVSEPSPQRRQIMADKFQIRVTDQNGDVFTNSDVVVMAVKPQVLDAVLQDLQQQLKQNEKIGQCLIISIIAGKTMAAFARFLPDSRLARVMPNTPALIGMGASAYVLNEKCTDADGVTVEAIMGSCGIVEKVGNEGLLDAVTGLSGSGPAYIYLLIEALSDGAVRQGLPRATATKLAAQTVMGSANMVLQNTNQHPGELKDAVTSPGGTTIAGVHALETGCFRGTIMNAVEAAANRSRELGRL